MALELGFVYSLINIFIILSLEVEISYDSMSVFQLFGWSVGHIFKFNFHNPIGALVYLYIYVRENTGQEGRAYSLIAHEASHNQ